MQVSMAGIVPIVPMPQQPTKSKKTKSGAKDSDDEIMDQTGVIKGHKTRNQPAKSLRTQKSTHSN